MRLQLALNVKDLDEAVDFYSKMFDVQPSKTRPGYANFAIEDPPLKLALFENADAVAADFQHLNHLGVETFDTAEVTAAEQRLGGAGIETTGVEETECCYAGKTETWVTSPDGASWEWYVKTADVETFENTPTSSSACC